MVKAEDVNPTYKKKKNEPEDTRTLEQKIIARMEEENKKLRNENWELKDRISSLESRTSNQESNSQNNNSEPESILDRLFGKREPDKRKSGKDIYDLEMSHCY